LIERSGRRRVVRAVDGISFDIPRGSSLALVGESGCGKSTVARCAVGLLRPTRGRVTVDGAAVASDRGPPEHLRGRIQMIFQDPFASLNPRWRVRDIVGEPLRAAGLARGAAAERAAELLEAVGLDADDGRRYPHQFSGGQRQRISIARALASEPDFIVCDEPTSALDVSVQAQILNLMKDLQARLGLTFLLISHDLAVVHHMADRIGVMYLGRLCELADADPLFDRPRHPYTRLLLEAVPDLDAIGRDRPPLAGEVPSPIDPPSGCAFHPRCPHADARCRAERPELLPADGVLVACHAVAEGRLSS
jgi:peptide/nickel transport system ATP-binding protein